MGNIEARHRVWVAITADDPETVRKIFGRYPELMNAPISDDKKTNAITRAAYLDRPHIIAELISLGADVNRCTATAISALMWAAAKGNIESVRLLVNFNADPLQTGPYEMNATDFAVLYGAYSTAYYLQSLGYSPRKTPEEYAEIKMLMQTNYVDFSGFLMSLDKEIPPEIVPFFTLAPIEREQLFEDPIRDPSETWGNWAKRVLEFERPPMIERNSLNARVVPLDREAVHNPEIIMSSFHKDDEFNSTNEGRQIRHNL